MKKILVVEDDKDITRAMAIRLRSAGYEVAVAQDAVLAATVASKARPDLAILDISLPGGDGFKVAERLHDILGGIPTIFVTASKRPDLPARARAMGALGFLEKPYDASMLLALVNGALGAPADPASPPPRV